MRWHTPRAFTLVEIVVVIVIISILTTIGFISYTSYLVNTRDSKRIAHLTKSVENFQSFAIRKKLPDPDNAVAILSGGLMYAKQGKLGDGVLETIHAGDPILDPKDQLHYTYLLADNKKHFQFLALMENIQYQSAFVSQAQATYESRYPRTFGSNLGVLTQTSTNLPLEDLNLTGAVLDIQNVGTLQLTSYLSDDEYVEGSSTDFGVLAEVLEARGKGWTVQDNQFVCVDSNNDGRCPVSGTGSSVTPYWTSMTTAQGLNGNYKVSMFQDSSGKIWLGSGNYTGVQVINTDSTITNYTFGVGPVGVNYIIDITQDTSGNIWLSSNGGVHKYNGASWATLTTTGGLVANRGFAIQAVTNGDVWYAPRGGSGGVQKYNGSTWTHFSTAQGIPHSTVVDISEDISGNVWIATYGGISKYNGSTWQTYTSANGLLDNTIYTIYTTVNGDIWTGHVGGVSKYDGSTWQAFPLYSAISVEKITEDSLGNVWFASTNLTGNPANPIKMYQKSDSTFVSFHPSTSSGMLHNAAKSVMFDDAGIVWLSSTSGISKYHY